MKPLTDYDFIIGWMRKASETAKRQGKKDSASLWNDAIEHLEYLKEDNSQLEESLSKSFCLTDDQTESYLQWLKNHKCNSSAGVIGGEISVKFTPTGLGLLVQAECICGEKINLTDSSEW